MPPPQCIDEVRSIADNLRDSFRIIALARERADSCELPGVSIACPGVAFQMFNAAFLSAPVRDRGELALRVAIARRYFEDRGIAWSFWFCESRLEDDARRRLMRVCEDNGLRIASEMPGMIASAVKAPLRRLPALEIREVTGPGLTLEAFRDIGAACFHVPAAWFCEVFDGNPARRAFRLFVGYRNGVGVSTSALVVSAGAIGIYNVATLPSYRGEGFGEAMTRHAIEAACQSGARAPLVLQATSQGLPLYERMGFEAVTRIVVFNSR